MEGEKKTGFMDRLKDATSVVVSRTREGVEDLQQRHELSQAYGDLGRTAVDLVESGAVSHPELIQRVEKIKTLKAELASAEPPAPAEPPTPS